MDTTGKRARTADTILSLRDVTAGYDGRPQIEHVDLDITRQDFVGIIGPNGSGKTTLLRVMLGLITPMEGTVSYYRDGTPTRRLTIGYLPQYNAIDKDFPISVADTVLSGLSNRKGLFGGYDEKLREQAMQTMRKMDIDALAQRPIKALSGGQLQRVLLARAIASDPEVVVLDEPSTYVDSQFERLMRATLQELNQRHATIIMVSHDTQYVNSHAQTIIHVDHGQTRSERGQAAR